MKKLFYAVMYTPFADFLGEAASYVEGTIKLKGLTGSEIASYEGSVNRLDAMELNNEQLSAMIDGFLAQAPNDVLGVMSLAQGKWLHANHPSFKQESTNETV
ncbi:MAG: hypothetical protein GY830_04375, partial [Bacteroidetes bacterium]|nr:hypothetical protein [Bacteroidota bacterium]